MTNCVGITCCSRQPKSLQSKHKIKKGMRGSGALGGESTVEENRASALLRYFTWRIAVEIRMKRSKYDIGKVKTRYNDNDKSEETPFVDSTVNPPTPIQYGLVRSGDTENGY